MRYFILGLLITSTLLVAGCASTSKEQLYYDTAKSISKDNTVSQTA